ncbi:DUF5753 domain-containing protein [Nocardia callitridis]|uniref:DUF5753 domain-containing protein n=1 Tax=Nocardia callitridis TaxID=648753 RepID=A0ABP9KKC1_9NOCA
MRPGLLQTAAYDHSLVRRIWPDATPAEWDRRVQIKQQRQILVTRRTAPIGLDVVIGEAALHRVSGGRAVMAAQLRHLADMSTRDNVTIRVLPFEAGYPDGVSMPPFVVLDFGKTSVGEPAEPTIVFLEGAVGDLYLEDEADVKMYLQAYDGIRRSALDAVASRDLLRRVAREREQRER